MTFWRLVWEPEGFFWGSPLDSSQVASILLRGLRAVALVFPSPTKFDPDGQAFGKRGVPFPVDVAHSSCAGMLLLRLEQLPRSRPREYNPLFSCEDGEPFLSSDIDKALSDALGLYSPRAAATRSLPLLVQLPA